MEGGGETKESERHGRKGEGEKPTNHYKEREKERERRVEHAEGREEGG